jgi:hypothetical protein
MEEGLMGRARKTIAKTGAGGIREILRSNREFELLAWKLPNETDAECLAADSFWSVLDQGSGVVVDVTTLWLAFERAGLTNAQFARAELGGKYPLDQKFWIHAADEPEEIRPWSVQDSIDAGIADQDSRVRAE